MWFAVLAVGLPGAALWVVFSPGATPAEARQAIQSLWEARVILGACLAGVIVLVGLFLRLCIGAALKRYAARAAAAAPLKKAVREERAPQPSPAETRVPREIQERQALQMLSLLQRAGRLVDFLQEDLSAYDDSQIGAAVRSIQENCRAVLEKHIAPAPVMEQEEGSRVTVKAGFDAGAIQLSGNVAGDPPFSGILQHRGWRAGRMDLPTLPPTPDPRIIAPAEVEIQ